MKIPKMPSSLIKLITGGQASKIKEIVKMCEKANISDDDLTEIKKKIGEDKF